MNIPFPSDLGSAGESRPPTGAPQPNRRQRRAAMRRTAVRTTAVAASLSVGATLLVSAIPAPAQAAPTPPSPWTIERVSTGAGGADSDGSSQSPVLSADGNHVVFESHASNLGATPTPYVSGGSILAKDLSTGAVAQVSLGETGAPLTYPYDPDVSADGSVVVFTHDFAEANKVVRRDRPQAMSTTITGLRPVRSAGVDDSGQRVVYLETTDPDNDDRRQHIFVRDSWAPDGSDPTQVSDLPSPDQRSSEPLISGDGTTVAYSVESPTGREVHVVDVSDLTAVSDAEVILGGSLPALDGTGRNVAYVARDAATGRDQVRTLDRGTGADRALVTVPQGAWITEVDLSADGSSVGYVVDGVDGGPQVWMTALASGTTEVAVSGVREASARALDVGVDGRAIVFASDRDDLVAGDANGASDVFIARRSDASGPAWPAGSAVAVVNVGSSFAEISWPEAADDLGVTGYQVYLDGDLVAELPASARSHVVAGLVAETTYAVSVVAVDGQANPSTSLSSSVTTAPRSTEPGTASLIATPGAGGSVHLAWDPDAGATTYRIMRAVPDSDELWFVADVDGTTSSYDDTGLMADATYRYRIDVERDGSFVPYTVESAATTTPLAIAATSWKGSALIGNRVAVTIEGASGWQGAVAVTYDTWIGDDGSVLDDTRSVTTEVLAAEDGAAPGRYLADVPIDEGTARITAITGILTDGVDQVTRDAARLPIAVRAAAAVTVLAPEGTLPGARVVIDGVAQSPIEGGAAWAVPAVPPGQRTIRVLAAGGRELARATHTFVAGRTSEVAVTPAIPGSLVVRVLDGDGVAVDGAMVTFRHAGEQDPIGSIETDGLGLAAVPGTIDEGDELDIEVDPPQGMPYLVTQSAATVGASDGLHDVTLAPMPSGRLTGLVLLDGATPAAGANIVAVQVRDGYSTSFSAVTDADGRYVLDGLAGPAQVHVTYRQDPVRSLGTVDLAHPATVLDVSLAQAGTYRVSIDLRTRTAADPSWKSAVIDSEVVASHRVQVDVNGRPQLLQGGEAVVRAEPGDVVRFCAGGGGTGWTEGCTELVLGDDPLVGLELAIESRAAVRAQIARPVGGPVKASLTSATIMRVEGGGHRSVRTIRFQGNEVDAALPEPGSYVMLLQDFSGDGTYASSRAVWFDVDEGGIADLGTIHLVTSAWTTRSSVTVVRPTIAPGGDGEIRVALKPDGQGEHRAVQARLALPAGTEIVPGSLTVAGAPATFTMEGGVAVIPLGDRTFGPATTPDAVVVRARFSSGEAAPGSSLDVTVDVTSTQLGVARTHHVGSATVHVAGVTLAAPAESVTRTVELGGHAPAGTQITVHDGGTLVGTAVATPGGVWFLTATVPNLGAGYEHVLVATTELDGVLLTSEPSSLVVDERLPVLEKVGVVQVMETGGAIARYVEIDPMAGIAHFPYVWRANALADHGTMRVSAEFGGRGSVEDVQAGVGTRTADAVAVGGGRYVADVPVRTDELGGIGLDYRSNPGMATLDDIPVLDEEQVRGSLPAPLADFGPSVVTEDHDPATNTQRAHFTTALPSLGDGGQLAGTVSFQRGVTYTPSADELADAERAGVPVYGSSYTVTETETGVVIEGSAYIAEEHLGMTGEQPAAGVTATSGAALSSFYAPVRVGYKYAFQTGTSADSLISLFGWKEKYDRLNGLMDWANKNCNAEHRAWAHSEIYLKHLEAVRADLVKLVLVIGGGVLAPETVGIGTVALWATSFLIEKLVDHQQMRDVDRFKYLLETTCQFDDEEPYIPWDRDWLDVADPTWIHDPSGFVYEAVPSNRIEGVTATLLHSDTEDGTFLPWDAEWYGQSNPLTTDGLGAYGWDVPEGWWQVQYTKAGYEVARSEVLEVLPPHFDVNVGLVSLAAPSVTSVEAVPGADPAIEITFDRYMELDAGDTISVATAGGDEIAGTVEPVDAEEGPTGTFARTFRFVADGDVPRGEELTVTVDAMATSYAGAPMRSASTTTVTIAPAPAVRGTVTGPDGAPLAGLSVLAYAETDGWLPTAVGTTAEDGSYTIEDLPDGAYRLYFSGGSVAAGEWNGDAASRGAAAPIAVAGGGAPEPVDATLVLASSVSGTLTDGSGAPLAGVTVLAFRPGDTWVATGSATTAADGTYRMSGLPADTYQVRFSGPGITTEWFEDAPTRAASTPVEVTSGAAIGGIDASLATPSSVGGSVTGTGGAPLAGVTVMAFGEHHTWVATATATTAADGSYRITGLPAGTYHLRFSGPGVGTEWHHDATDRRRATPVVVTTASTTVDAVLGSA